MMPFFKQEILIESDAKGGLDSKEYTEALVKTLGFRKTLSEIMSTH
jgi:amidase